MDKLELAREILAAISSKFGTNEIPNPVLKNWMCETYPTHFASTGQAANFIEKQLASVDFASSVGRGTGGLVGILRNKDGGQVAEGTKGASRFWVAPVGASIRSKLEIYNDGELGSAAKTKLRRAPLFGVYVAAKKDNAE